MTETSRAIPSPVALSEQPWADPWDGLLSGTYRRRLSWQLPDTPDHLVLYIRGTGGDPDAEYVAETTICGTRLDGATRPDRVTGVCPACLEGVGQAFARARAEVAETAPSRVE